MIEARQTTIGCLVGCSAGVAVAYGGGFAAEAQWVFAGTAAASAAVVVPAGGRALRMASSPPVLALIGVGLLAAFSAFWTLGEPAAAVRWGTVSIGYAAIATAVGATLRAEVVAAAIAVTAGVTGMLGLVSATMLSTPFAERVGGGWRPEGPFGYGPALALVQVCALPVLLVTLGRGRPAASAAAAVGIAVAAGVLVLNANRTALALATLVAVVALAAPAQTVGASRSTVVAALLLAASAGLAVHATAGGWHPPDEHASSVSLVIVIAIVASAVPAWVLVRGLLPPAPRGGSRPLRLRTIVVIAVVASLAVGLGAAASLRARPEPSYTGFSHGRTWIWHVAGDAALDRPLGGSGAGTFLDATILDQLDRRHITRFAHDLPLEVGVELGAAGLLLVLALYAGSMRALWRARGSSAVWLVGPTVAAFLASNAVDWTWHLAGVGAVFAVALGTLVAAGIEPNSAAVSRAG